MLKAVFLGSFTCTAALDARSYNSALPQYGDTSSSIVYTSSAQSFAEEALKTSSLFSSYSSAVQSNVQATSTPRPTSNNPNVAPYTNRPNGTSPGLTPTSSGVSGSCASYWLENVKHQGVASFNPNPGNYTIFRNVKDFGARGDGVTDDTAAIQRAVTDGNRCGPSACESSTNTPAIVYFPEGNYLISKSIIDYYYTQVRFSGFLGEYLR